MTSAQSIQESLSRLIGLPLWGSGRAVDMEMFAFGERQMAVDRHGKEFSRGEYALHVQCAWHIAQHEKIIVASDDVHRPIEERAEADLDFDWEAPGSNRRDFRLRRLFEETSPTTSGVEAYANGRVVLSFEGGSELSIFPDRTGEDVEWWRFLKPGSDEPHLVFTSNGAQLQ